MVKRKCCACGIREAAASKEKISFHRFPVDKELSDMWAKYLGNKVIINERPEVRNKKYFLCSRHFEISMFPHQIRSIRLRKIAFPTIFTSANRIETDPLAMSVENEDIEDMPSERSRLAEAIPGTLRGMDVVQQSPAEIESRFFKSEPEDTICDEEINAKLDNSGMDLVPHSSTEMEEALDFAWGPEIIINDEDINMGTRHLDPAETEPSFNEHSYAAPPRSFSPEPLQSPKSVSTQTSPTLSFSTPRKEKYRKQIKSYMRRIRLLESKLVALRTTKPVAIAGFVKTQNKDIQVTKVRQRLDTQECT